MKKKWLAGLLVVALVGCGDELGLGNASEGDRVDIEAELDAIGFLGEDFGLDGLNPAIAPHVSSLGGSFNLAPPGRWGRFRRPTNRRVVIDVDRAAGTATVTKSVSFAGTFSFMNADTDQRVDKRLVETMTQSAVLSRLDQEVADPETQRMRRWKLDALTVQHWTMGRPSDPLPQPVNITSLEVFVGDVSVATVSDPTMLLEVMDDLPHVPHGASVTVAATVENDNPAPNADVTGTYVFLHVFHADANGLRWNRLPMGLDDGRYWATWTAHRPGRNRLVVDAIDAGSFDPDPGAVYSASMWGLPYSISAPVAAQ